MNKEEILLANIDDKGPRAAKQSSLKLDGFS